MTRTLLVAGTASHVGKSTVAAGICRLLSDRGVSVAPFKAQNMSNNARVVPISSDPDSEGEIGVSQWAQARAARIPPTTDMNPVLLKPRGNGESQLVLQGRAIGTVGSGAFYADHWMEACQRARESFERLARAYDVIVAEGAGSIAEINLHHRDLANVETARFASRFAGRHRGSTWSEPSGCVEILLLVDVERGGAFASLYGTLELLPDDLRELVRGAVITKFRGDASLLEPGIDEIEERTGVVVRGVVPYEDPGLPEEDGVSLPANGESATVGADDGIDEKRAVTIAVPLLPHISNTTDLEPLAREPGVRVSYRPLDASYDDADAVVVPGTKNTVDGGLALVEAGLDDELRGFSGPIVGICGGYQLLGERLTDASNEGTTDVDVVDCVGLLPVETRFSTKKRTVRVDRRLSGSGPLSAFDGRVRGYEIHAGETELTEGETTEGTAIRPGALGISRGSVFGTYVHGLFENEDVRDAFLDRVFASADRSRPATDEKSIDPYDRAARLVETNVALEDLGAIGSGFDGE